MTIAEHRMPEAIILTLESSLDFSSRPQFMKAIHHAIHDHYPHVIVNLERVNCTDTVTLGMLVIAYQKLTLHHRRLSLLSPSPSLHSHLQSMNFPRLIPIYDSLDAALTRRMFPFSVV